MSTTLKRRDGSASEAEGVAVGEAKGEQVRQSADSVGTTPTVHPSRCTCDELSADHVFRDSKTYPDNGDTEETFGCLTCGAEWVETIQYYEAQRRYESRVREEESLFTSDDVVDAYRQADGFVEEIAA